LFPEFDRLRISAFRFELSQNSDGDLMRRLRRRLLHSPHPPGPSGDVSLTSSITQPQNAIVWSVARRLFGRRKHPPDKPCRAPEARFR
jgi:hypothetical protein